MRRSTAAVASAARSQEKRAARSRPSATSRSRCPESASRAAVAEAMPCGLEGSTYTAAGPAISGMAEVPEVITGVPQAMPSSSGRPKPSIQDGNRSASAPRYSVPSRERST